jgi:hypothetical protein
VTITNIYGLNSENKLHACKTTNKRNATTNNIPNKGNKNYLKPLDCDNAHFILHPSHSNLDGQASIAL